MPDQDSIFRKECCPVCHGLKYVEIKSKKYKAVIEPCNHCNGKGFLKILKSDYEY